MDARQRYRAWAAAVKSSGGVVTVFPSGPSKGAPAARYPAPRIAELQKKRQLGEPGTWSANREWGYYLAAPVVIEASKTLPAATKAEIAKAADTLKRSWFGDFGVDLGGAIKKTALLAGVGYVVAQVVLPLVRRKLEGR